MPAVINGSLILLYFEGEPVAYIKSNEDTIKNDLRETTHKRSGGGAGGKAEYAGGKVSFSGSGEGLYVGQSKNLLARSESFDNSIWTKSATVVVADNADGADGRRSADTLNFSASGYAQQTAPADSVAFGADATYSVYLKGTGDLTIELGDDDASSTVTVTLTGTLTRYEVSHNMGSGVDVTAIIRKGTATSCIAWGAQLELGIAATEYVPSGVSFSTLFAAIKAGTQMACEVSSNVVDDKEYTGTAIIADLKRTHSDNDNVTFSCTYNITGDLSEATVS